MKALRTIGALVGILIGLFLIVNIDKGVQLVAPDQIRIGNLPGQSSLATLFTNYPGTHVLNEKDRIVSVPIYTVEDHLAAFRKDPAIRLAYTVPVEPHFSLPQYLAELKKELTQFSHGEMGTLEYQSSKYGAHSINSQLKLLFLRTISTLIPGILLGILLGYAGALLAAWKPRVGRVLNRLQDLTLSLPDFLVVVLIQFIAIFLTKMVGHSVISIMQIGDQVPKLIPIVVISLLPSALVYGSVRIAVEREWNEGYIRTAYSKGLSRTSTLFKHLLRNTMEDLLTILPRAVTVGITTLVIAEVMTGTFGLGGYAVNSSLKKVTSLSVTCAMLASVALLAQLLFSWIRNRFIVNTKEGA